jgi:hypothetical protein
MLFILSCAVFIVSVVELPLSYLAPHRMWRRVRSQIPNATLPLGYCDFVETNSNFDSVRGIFGFGVFHQSYQGWGGNPDYADTRWITGNQALMYRSAGFLGFYLGFRWHDRGLLPNSTASSFGINLPYWFLILVAGYWPAMAFRNWRRKRLALPGGFPVCSRTATRHSHPALVEITILAAPWP